MRFTRLITFFSILTRIAAFVVMGGDGLSLIFVGEGLGEFEKLGEFDT